VRRGADATQDGVVKPRGSVVQRVAQAWSRRKRGAGASGSVEQTSCPLGAVWGRRNWAGRRCALAVTKRLRLGSA